MLKYDVIANSVIEINIGNNYSVYSFAKWIKDSENYEVTLYLHRKDIDTLDLIQKYEKVLFENSDMKTIRTDMADYITVLHNTGEFKPYIRRFEEEQSCYDIGYSTLEDRIGIEEA